tara:strand:- start:10431 stop:11612 length:1182 start_codon:yes stop_codon:yes gene_type:complete
MSIRLLISTGEVSGDLQGGLLVSALKREAELRGIHIEIFALGGKRMKEAGANLIADTSSIGAIGFWEALPFVIPTLKVQSLVDDVLKENPPNVVVLIDYMGPNIRLGNKVKNMKSNIPIVYYIAPQEWAWRVGSNGTTDLIGFSDRILAIFKSEADFYSKQGGNVTWVGHPMLDTYRKLPDRENSFSRLGIDPHKKVILLFPASRKQELRYLVPVLLQAALMLQKYDPSIYFVVPAGLEIFEEPLRNALASFGISGHVIASNQTDELKPFLFSIAELAIGKSGTVNMELALNSVPQIVGYKISRVTAFILKKFLRFSVDHISPVNLLLKERLIPELVQKEFTAEAIVKLAIPLLEDTQVRSSMIKGFGRLRSDLGEIGVTDRAAKEIIELAIK